MTIRPAIKSPARSALRLPASALAQQGIVTDYVGGIDGTLVGFASTDWSNDVPSQIDNARSLSFDDVDNAVNVTGLSVASGSLTFCGWFNSGQGGSQNYAFDSKTGRLIFAWNSGNAAGKLAIFDGTAWRDFGDAPNDGDWHFVLFECDDAAGQCSCFVDGSQSGLTETFASTSIGSDTYLGAAWTGTSSFYRGKLAQVRIFNAVLSAADKTALENGNSPSATPVAYWRLDDGT